MPMTTEELFSASVGIGPSTRVEWDPQLDTALCPIASALINLTSVATVIYATQVDGVHNWTGYNVLLVSEYIRVGWKPYIQLNAIGDFVYGGRAVVYALLAATDPVR